MINKPKVRLRHPALRVLNAEFSDPPPEWRILEEHRREIEARLPSVGRIRQGACILGTGILVARHVVMTNRHVAESFSDDIDAVAKIRVGWTPVIDFIGEVPLVPTGPHDDATCGGCRIRSIVYISKEHDLALLRVAFHNTQGPEPSRRPRPLTLSTSPLLIAKKRPVYLIGFPRQDPKASAAELRIVLGTQFGVKRVQPGYIIEVPPEDTAGGARTEGQHRAELVHDASTLTGNSGSCVIDVATNQVIGLHTRGAREDAGDVSFNRAIAFAYLPEHDQDALRKAGLALTDASARPPQAD